MTEIPFIQPTEENSYKVFPDSFENDSCVFFHGTSEEAAASILRNGFMPQGNLRSTSFAVRSSYPLGYACTKRAAGARGAILAVKIENTKIPGIRIEGDFLYIDDHNIQPEIIGCCYIPSNYNHV